MKMFCELAGAVLDGETGDLLEYRHLVKHPNNKKIWGGAFGKEVDCLSQGLPSIVKGTNKMSHMTVSSTTTYQKRRTLIDAESPSAAI